MAILKKNKINFIAEISANHCGNINMAKKLIKCAKDNGATAAKIQTYTAETMTLNSKKKYFRIKNGLWKGLTFWQLYKKASTPLNWHKHLFQYSKKINIPLFSSPFSEESVDFLETLNCPMYKVASPEITHIPLIKKIARTKKPIIISTGMSNLKEIKIAFDTAKKYGCKDITLLYCVSNYPAMDADFNLNNIHILKKKFNCKIGFSDHSLNSNIAFAAVACGAEVVEKHIALKNQKKGFDIKFSIKGTEIKNFITKLNEAKKLLGKKFFFRSKNEIKNQIYRRSIFVAKNISKGEKFSKENLKIVRPNYGLSPIFYHKIINKRSPFKLLKGNPLKKEIIKYFN